MNLIKSFWSLNLVPIILVVPPLTIEDELLKFIEENTRKQNVDKTWRDLHIGRITSSIFGDVLKAGEYPHSLIEQILHGSSLKR